MQIQNEERGHLQMGTKKGIGERGYPQYSQAKLHSKPSRNVGHWWNAEESGLPHVCTYLNL